MPERECLRLSPFVVIAGKNAIVFGVLEKRIEQLIFDQAIQCVMLQLIRLTIHMENDVIQLPLIVQQIRMHTVVNLNVNVIFCTIFHLAANHYVRRIDRF